MNYIQIENKGQIIKSTNYWVSDMAAAGYYFLSYNSGVARLLIPDAQKKEIREMKTANEVIISKGNKDGVDSLELLFEDGSENPYVIWLSLEQVDRDIPEHGQGGGFTVVLWTKTGQKARFPGRYRIVDKLPFMKEWINQ